MKNATIIIGNHNRKNGPNKGVQSEGLLEQKEEIQQKIENLKDYTELPDTISLIRNLFKENSICQLGFYRQFHKAVHIDILTLGETINDGDGDREYYGDSNCEFKGVLEHECLIHSYYFLQSVYEYYGFDFSKQTSRFEKLVK